MNNDEADEQRQGENKDARLVSHDPRYAEITSLELFPN
jgi:hypothetical protein